VEHPRQFFSAIGQILGQIEVAAIERLASELAVLHERGRLFLLGVGGSAGNCSHAVNDSQAVRHRGLLSDRPMSPS
jgi:D-sedoheptulose 7-phosphate isomerase